MKKIIIALALISLLCSPAYALLKSPNLIAGYRFEGNALDWSGNGNNGTLGGNTTYVTGKFGKAVSFDGTYDYVSLPATNFTSLSSYTVAGWAYFNALTNDSPMLSMGDKDTSDTDWMQLNIAGTKISFQGKYGGVGFTGVESPINTLSTNVWIHIAWIITGATAGHTDNGTMQIYANGVQVASVTGIDPLNPSKIAGIDSVLIGGRVRYIGYYGDQSMNGLYDEVKIYNRALTAAEIRQSMLNFEPGEW